MQRQLSVGKSEDAVSPVIGTVLILAIMITITGTMLAWGIPQIQKSEAYAIYTSAQNNLLNFDADLDHVITQGEGASRTSTVSFSSGTFVERDNLDEIRYYYTTVAWSDPKIVGVKEGSTDFAMLDRNEVVDDYRVTLSYPNTCYDSESSEVTYEILTQEGCEEAGYTWVPDGTEWTGTTSASIVSEFPYPLTYGTSATYSSTANTTQVGGFYIYGTDALSYRYASVSGVFKLRMFNGAIFADEPGGSFYTASNPLTRTISDSESYKSFTVYQTDYTISSAAKTLSAGNFIFDARNEGGNDISLEVYSVRIGVTGETSAGLKNYYTNDLDFIKQTDNFFTTADSVLLAKDYGMLTAEEDVVFSQSTPFDFRILERTINVNFSLR